MFISSCGFRDISVCLSKGTVMRWAGPVCLWCPASCWSQQAGSRPFQSWAWLLLPQCWGLPALLGPSPRDSTLQLCQLGLPVQDPHKIRPAKMLPRSLLGSCWQWIVAGRGRGGASFWTEGVALVGLARSDGIGASHTYGYIWEH